MWADFDHLRRLWSARREGSGGTAALAGFKFQLAAALLEVVHSKAVIDRPNVFIEALSDIVSAEGGYLVVTQVKLTLHSGAFRKALNELWEINTLASKQVPALASQLRYRVLVSSKVLKDVEAAMARWTPDDPASESDLDTFRSHMSVRVEADPLQSLAIHLVNAFGDPNPFETVNNWLGILLSNPTTLGFEHSCRSIVAQLDALAAAARERIHRFYVWEAHDQAPSEPLAEPDPEKATLTGQLPNRMHLREGRFLRIAY